MQAQLRVLSAVRWMHFSGVARRCSSKFSLVSAFPELQPFETQLKSYADLHDFALRESETFWKHLSSRLNWHKPFSKVLDYDWRVGRTEWFIGGKLNVAVNCVDRHLALRRNEPAVIWERDEPNTHRLVTYGELYTLMNRVANALRRAGVQKGDKVILYLPSSPLAIATMLACARIGAVHSVVFSGFSSAALELRVNDAKAKVVVTQSHAVRGGKRVDLRSVVNEAVQSCPTVQHVLVHSEEAELPFDAKTPVTAKRADLTQRDVDLDALISECESECDPVWLDAEDPLFILYTSGSTGTPKGVVHSQAGYLLYAAVTHQHCFDIKRGDRFGCVADIGWITGHSYIVYGPLANGVATLAFEGTPLYPNASRYWEMVQRLRLSHIYLSPTVLRMLLRYDASYVRNFDRSSLRALGCVGELLNAEAFKWFHEVVGEGKLDLIDTWWQTETGGVLIAPRPSEPGDELIAAAPMRTFFGIDACLIDTASGKPLQLDSSQLKHAEETHSHVEGALCIRKPWPGIARTLNGDHKRFVSSYFSVFPGYYFTGDGAYAMRPSAKAINQKDVYFRITGRLDDVINTTGHRVGTAELEDILDSHELVAESAVVGFPHDVKGEGIYAYVTLKSNDGDRKAVETQLKQLVRQNLAAYAVPDFIHFAQSLPKTRSGKIMRRILRKIAVGQSDAKSLGDISTLSDPAVVEELIATHRKLAAIKKNK